MPFTYSPPFTLPTLTWKNIHNTRILNKKKIRKLYMKVTQYPNLNII